MYSFQGYIIYIYRAAPSVIRLYYNSCGKDYYSAEYISRSDNLHYVRLGTHGIRNTRIFFNTKLNSNKLNKFKKYGQLSWDFSKLQNAAKHVVWIFL